MHSPQSPNTPDNNDVLFDFNQIFIARERQLAEFESVLAAWRRIMAQTPLQESPSTDIPSPNNKLQGLVVLLYGRGGFGKSTLLKHYHLLATQQNEHPFFGYMKTCDTIDWETAIDVSKRAIYNPSQGQRIDISEYFKILCAQLATRLDRLPRDFRAYQQAASEVERAKRETNEVLEKLRRDKDNQYDALRGASVEVVASAISTVTPGAVGKIVDNTAVKKGADALLKLTGEQLSHIYQQIRNRLHERIDDLLSPERRLGLALGSDLYNFARNAPILFFFDTYEEIDEGDALLRIVMAAAGSRVGWVIAGRDNLWSGAGQTERSIALEYGYREIVSIDRSLSVNFNSEDVGAFTPGDIQNYFAQLCDHYPCNPPLTKLTDEDAKRVWNVTQGIPLAVNIAAKLYSETADLDKVTEDVEGQKEIIDGMVRRYLLHTRIDESERAKLYAIAMLRRPTQRGILAIAIGLKSKEAKIPNRFNEALSHLHRRYSFIFTERDEPTLHQEVRRFLRLWLLQRRDQLDIAAINERLKTELEKTLNQLEQQRNYDSIKSRLQDEQWRGAYLDLTEQQFWFDPIEGLNHLLPFMIAAAIYQREANKEAAEVGDLFAPTIQRLYRDWWTWADTSFVHVSSRNPLSGECNGLEELLQLLNQRRLKLPTFLNKVEELEAALWWRLAESYEREDNSKAIEWYEKALKRLGQEDELKQSLAETYLFFSNMLYDQKKYSECVIHLTRSIELNPNYQWAYNNRGLAFHEQGDFARAILDYNDALRLDPNYAKAYNNRGLAFYNQGDFARAILDYNAALRLDPNYAKAYNNRGLVFRRQGDFAHAILDYNAALRLDPNDAKAYYNHAYAHLYLQNSKQAMADFTKAAEIEPSNVDTAWMIVFASMGKVRPGIETAGRLEEIAAINPQHYVADICVAVALGLHEKLKDGLSQLEQVHQKEPQDEDSYFWQGMLSAYYYPNKPHIAIEAIEKALELHMPPILLTPLYWLQKDRPQFFEQYAKPLLDKYGV